MAIVSRPHKLRENESLREFSYDLLELLDKSIKANPTIAAMKNSPLSDRFIKGVEDHYLYIMLLERVERHPELMFKDLRDYAFKVDMPDKHHAYSTAMMSTSTDTAEKGLSSSIAELIKGQKLLTSLRTFRDTSRATTRNGKAIRRADEIHDDEQVN